VQRLFSQGPSQSWVTKVTDDLYRRTTCEVSGLAGTALAAALVQLYTCRAALSCDPTTKPFLDSLVHVKFDRAAPCPMSVGHPLPDLPLYSLDAAPTSTANLAHDLYANGVTTLALVAGSWT